MSRRITTNWGGARTRLSPLLGLLLAACTGEISGTQDPAGNGTGGVVGGGPPQVEVDGMACNGWQLLPRGVRGLNSTQYLSSIKAAFPQAPPVASPFESADRSAQFSTSAGIRRFDFNASLGVFDNGRAVGRAAFAQLSAQHPCLSATADAACIGQVVADLGRAVYRRPVTASEAGKLVLLFQTQQVISGDVKIAADYLVQAMLASPRFLFRSELGAATEKPGEFALTPHEVASALAYSLTDAPPDAELAAAADADALKTPEQVRAQSTRLLQSGAGVEGMATFTGEFLLTRDFPAIEKDPALFPLFDADTRDDLYADYQDTIASTLSSQAPTLSALLTSRDFVVRPRTAALVGWQSPTGFSPEGSSFTATEPGRMGILTHPVVMGRFAHRDETNPVSRGHLVTGKLLCVAVPPPPMAVMFPKRLDDGVPRTLRTVLQEQHAQGTCAACHQMMDPVGYPFEAFDAVGRYRTTDSGLPIDTTGNIMSTNDIDGPVQDAEDLITRLAGSDRVHDCVAGAIMKYVTGVDDPADYACTAAGFAQIFRDHSGNIPELFLSMLESDAFLKRVEAP